MKNPTDTKEVENGIHMIDVGRGVIVIKVGSAVLADPNGFLDPKRMGKLARLSRAWRDQGRSIVLVSSGAIAAGRGATGLLTRPRNLPEKQALAAIGQNHLMYAYSRAFGRYDIRVAQVLLTREDMDDRRRYLNARYTVERLLTMGVVPIINENDTIAVEEIEFGDNDVLAAMVAVKLQARLLLILSTVDGLLSVEPGRGTPASLIPQVNAITPDIEALSAATVSPLGRGGIRSKIQSAQTAMRSGIPAILANGRDPKVYRLLEKNQVRGTFFAPEQGRRLRRRAQWILSARPARSRRLVVDEGARRALLRGKKSLLAAGVAGILGRFQPGDVVDIAEADRPPFACGLVNYSSQEMERIKGLRSNQIESVLGRKPYDEVIHRDNMVILENE